LIAGAYVAPESWWVKTLIERPIRPGRPPIDDQLRPEFWDQENEEEVWILEGLMGCPGDPDFDAAVREQHNARRRFLYRQKKKKKKRAAL
jgi:hypothetical protein